jgi:hypothetical protein
MMGTVDFKERERITSLAPRTAPKGGFFIGRKVDDNG